jgi:large subunit ribosomal protein L18
MRPIHAPKSRIQLRRRRHLRVRRKVAGTAERPRLVVFRSLKHIYAQLVDDDRGVTLLGVGDGSEGLQPTARARWPGAKRSESSSRSGPRPPASPRWCSTGRDTVTMGASRRSPRARVKADWSSNGGRD